MHELLNAFLQALQKVCRHIIYNVAVGEKANIEMDYDKEEAYVFLQNEELESMQKTKRKNLFVKIEGSMIVTKLLEIK